MKKKKLLGILAVLMVFALALTGCGQQSGEQNAGATGSESQNEAIDNGNSSADEIVETEPENGGELPNDNTSSNKSPTQDADGNYIYTITIILRTIRRIIEWICLEWPRALAGVAPAAPE